MIYSVLFFTLFTIISAFPKQLTFELPDKERLCFYEKLSINKKFIFSYRVIKGGNNDVDVKLLSPSKKVLYEKQKMHFESHTFKTYEEGSYAICFSNEFSSFTHKQVFFELRPEIFETLQEEAGLGDKPTALTLMETSLDNIHVHLSEVEEYQTLYRNEESEGRSLSERLNESVLFWSIVVALSIVVTGYGQVLILKTFFNDKPNVGLGIGISSYRNKV